MTISSLSEIVEREITELQLPSSPRGLYDPIDYILQLGGKRIRPVLVLLGYSFFKENPGDILKEAISVELFHNFTLMHDDIMDNASLRRGQPTVHEKWDETTAILSGDAMLIKGYQLLEDQPADVFKVAMTLFNQAALEVCEGQQLDLDLQKENTASVEDYVEMIRLKTAVLLGYSLQLGALLAGASDQDQNLLKDMGVSMGLAFQLMDDHLDTFGDETFGKKIGGDILENKNTFLLISTKASEQAAELVEWLNKEPSDEKISSVTALYRKAGAEEQSLKEIEKYSKKSIDQLNEINGNETAKELLRGYIAQLNERVS